MLTLIVGLYLLYLAAAQVLGAGLALSLNQHYLGLFALLLFVSLYLLQA